MCVCVCICVPFFQFYMWCQYFNASITYDLLEIIVYTCTYFTCLQISRIEHDFPRVELFPTMYVANVRSLFLHIDLATREPRVSVCLRVPELNRVSVLVLVGRGEERKRLGGRREKGEGRERQKLKSHARMERTEKTGGGGGEGQKAKTEEPERRGGR